MYIDLRLGLGIAALAALFAVCAWWVFVRPVPEQSAAGRVTGIAFQPAERVERSVPQFARSLERTSRQVRYELPDRKLLSIELDDGETVRFVAPLASASTELEPGARVRVVYEERGFWVLWSRRYVKAVARLDRP